jgi:hypothetical protein
MLGGALMTKNGGELKVYDKRTQKYAVIDDGNSWGKIQTPKMQLEVKQNGTRR